MRTARVLFFSISALSESSLLFCPCFHRLADHCAADDKHRSDRLQSRHSFPEEKRSKKHRRQRFKISADRNSLNGQLYFSTFIISPLTSLTELLHLKMLLSISIRVKFLVLQVLQAAVRKSFAKPLQVLTVSVRALCFTIRKT